MTYKCTTCGKRKDDTHFYPSWVRRKVFKCATCVLSYQKRRYQRIPEEKRVESAKAKRWERRRAVIKGYGGKCACCGEKHTEFLALHHVKNDGKKERNVDCYRKAIKECFPDCYTILCANCHTGIHHWGVCPHERYFAVHHPMGVVAQSTHPRIASESEARPETMKVNLNRVLSRYNSGAKTPNTKEPSK